MSQPPSGPDGPQDRGYEPAGYAPGGYLVPNGDQPPRPPAPGARLGRVSGVSVRQEALRQSSSTTLGLTVLELRLLEPGSPRPLDVVLRGRSLSGTVRDGDWVEVAGPPDATGRWNVAKVQNLTTGATVVVMGGRPSKAATVVGLVLLGLMLLVVLLVVVGVVTSLASG
ncbi:hypothetical protein GCM10022197_22890 [Microlunatus spumicola]|uniref:DUF4178 domain-containing protein n=1 Tax=Microlunatus spumicola TaxID=81499 RepID=A0ABP6XFI4_9ACTN